MKKFKENFGAKIADVVEDCDEDDAWDHEKSAEDDVGDEDKHFGGGSDDDDEDTGLPPEHNPTTKARIFANAVAPFRHSSKPSLGKLRVLRPRYAGPRVGNAVAALVTRAPVLPRSSRTSRQEETATMSSFGVQQSTCLIKKSAWPAARF